MSVIITDARDGLIQAVLADLAGGFLPDNLVGEFGLAEAREWGQVRIGRLTAAKRQSVQGLRMVNVFLAALKPGFGTDHILRSFPHPVNEVVVFACAEELQLRYLREQGLGVTTGFVASKDRAPGIDIGRSLLVTQPSLFNGKKELLIRALVEQFLFPIELTESDNPLSASLFFQETMDAVSACG